MVIGGTTTESSQIFQNINSTFKILSEWSQNELLTYGPSLNITLDDYLVPSDSVTAAASSLDNAAPTTSVGGFANNSSIRNPALKERLQMFNSTVAATPTTLANSILGTNHSVLAKSQVQVNSSATSGDMFVLYALATVRLKDISDSIAKMPLMKGLKGFIYVNYNSSSTAITNANSSSAITAISNSSIYGRCAPGMVNTSAIVLNTTTGSTVTFKAEVSGLASTNLTTATPISTSARLVVPYYTATPEIDRALSTKKTVRYNERFVTQFSMTAGQNYNATLSPGISNPKRVILYPYFTGGNTQNTTFITNPLLSSIDSVPSTTSPFASIKDLQIYVGNLPMYQSPISYDYDTYLNETAQQGLDGGLVSQTGSGLLNQRSWNQLYRYYTCDISRRMNSEDGCSKSVQVSCTNATTCPMNVIAIIWYERVITVDTASGYVTQSM